jgi:hypothetical protein
MPNYLLRETPTNSGNFVDTGERMPDSAAETVALAITRERTDQMRYAVRVGHDMAPTSTADTVAMDTLARATADRPLSSSLVVEVAETAGDGSTTTTTTTTDAGAAAATEETAEATSTRKRRGS